MNTFGVCYCDLSAYEPNVTDLVRFDTYEEAVSYYTTKVLTSRLTNRNLWLVWIEPEKNRIIQFDQLSWSTKCKIVTI
jgi:hypothetical protein